MSEDCQWFVYILECDRKYLYTGISTDVDRRIEEHKQGPPLGAKFTRGIQKIELLYSVPVETRSLASRIEYRIKQLPKFQKEQVISGKYSLEQLMEFLNM